MKKIDKFLLLGILFCLSLSINGQNVYFTNNELSEQNSDMSLGGMAGLKVISVHDDLVFDSPQKEQVPFRLRNQDKVGDLYEYLLVLDISKNRDVKYVISRKGSAHVTEISKIFKPDFCYVYSVGEVENPISINKDNSRMGGASKVHGLSDIEVTTTVADLNFVYSPELKMKKSSSTAVSGAKVYIFSFDPSVLEKMRFTIDSLNYEFKTLDSLLVNNLVAQDKWDVLTKLEKDLEKANLIYERACRITVSAPKSNFLNIDLRQINVNEKVYYTIDPKVETEQVYNRTYDQHLAAANNALTELKFKSAAEFFRLAAQSSDALPEEKIVAESRASDADKYYEFMAYANGALKVLKDERKKDKNINYSLVESCYKTIIGNYENITRFMPNQELAKRIELFKKLLKEMPLVIEGKVYGTQMKKGILEEEVLTNVFIYAVSEPYNSDMKKDATGDYVGRVNEKGEFHVEVEKYKYKGLLFVPVNIKGYNNNTWQSLSEQTHLKTNVKIYK